MQTIEIKKFDQWLNKQNKSFLQEQATEVLAVINLLQHIQHEPKRDQFAQELLAQQATINYNQCELIPSLLASAYVIHSDNHKHHGTSIEYRLLLAEIFADTTELNNHQLQAFKAILNGESDTPPSPQQAVVHASPKHDMAAFIDQTLQQIETESHFGQTNWPNNNWLRSQCEAIMIWATRRYDLPLALRSLRARCYLDKNSSLAIKTTQEFMALQQGMDGSFGDYASTLLTLTKQQNQQQAQIEFNIKIKLALQVLWTCYEVEHQHNLFKLLSHNHEALFKPTTPQVATC